jgi:2-oxoisovalerate dehydrogenase E1 component
MADPLPPAAATGILRKALLARMVEERLLRLFSEGKLFGTLHTCIGQEMSGAVLSEFLRKGDTVFSNHRGHGHFLSIVGDPDGLVAELMGRAAGVCGGLGGSQHLCKGGFFSNGIQGGIVPVATGLALAGKLRAQGTVSVVFIGDGTLGEGAIYEAFNIAAKWQLPLLVVLEDNGIAQSTRQVETFAGSVAARAEGFGLGYASADTWDWRGFYRIAAGAVAAVRQGDGPLLLHLRTYRLKAHSKGDDTRPREEVEPFERKDPLAAVLLDADRSALVAEVAAEVETAVARAEAAPVARYAPPLGEPPTTLTWREVTVPKERLVRALRDCLAKHMRENEEVFLIGEDIESPYGGAFKATQGLSEEFPGRVRNTPISEAGIVGVGGGLALAGWRPVVEIMFGDFTGLAFDQLVNHASKFERMYNGQVKVNLVVRTPMGGRRGYGPTHSQTLDRHFIGVPGLRVLALHHLLTPDALYDPLLTGDGGPTLVIENKLTYGSYLRAEHAPGFHLLASSERFPTVWFRPEARRIDLTLLGYGGMTEMLATAAERLFEEHDLVAQALFPMQIHPFDVRPLLPVLQRSPRLLIVEEGQGFGAFGAEVLAQLAERAPGVGGQVARLGPPSDIIPSSGSMEKAMLPSVEAILERAVALCR